MCAQRCPETGDGHIHLAAGVTLCRHRGALGSLSAPRTPSPPSYAVAAVNFRLCWTDWSLGRHSEVDLKSTVSHTQKVRGEN